ncbi:MAG: BtpA family membrane complex biogenesis protein [Ignavibacteria bacterium]|nr:MAG: BtpA family membrane complex biogenesis protein [Ignavibacteria bacterium]
MKSPRKIFEKEKLLFGMVHTLASPGTPKYGSNVEEIIDTALSEAEILFNNNFDGIIIENMHDVPYLNRNVGPEVVSLMSIIGYEIKKEFQKPVGIQILAGANKEALAVAKAAGLDFIRAEGFVFSHIADEGLMNSDAGELLRYRKLIDAEDILIFTDIKKKHSSHNITADVDIVETAKAAEFFLSDGLIITGKSTAQEADINEIKNVYENTSLPVLIGSGITEENLENYFPYANGFIVGSYLKENSDWKNRIDSKRVSKLSEKFNRLAEKFQ